MSEDKVKQVCEYLRKWAKEETKEIEKHEAEFVEWYHRGHRDALEFAADFIEFVLKD